MSSFSSPDGRVNPRSNPQAPATEVSGPEATLFLAITGRSSPVLSHEDYLVLVLSVSLCQANDPQAGVLVQKLGIDPLYFNSRAHLCSVLTLILDSLSDPY